MKALALILAASLTVVGLAQSPYATQYVDLWKVVQDVRTAFRITPKEGISNDDLPILNIFLDNRQMDSLWNAINGLNGGPITTLEQLSGVKYFGPASIAVVLIFHRFPDEATVAPRIIGRVKL